MTWRALHFRIAVNNVRCFIGCRSTQAIRGDTLWRMTWQASFVNLSARSVWLLDDYFFTWHYLLLGIVYCLPIFTAWHLVLRLLCIIYELARTNCLLICYFLIRTLSARSMVNIMCWWNLVRLCASGTWCQGPPSPSPFGRYCQVT